MPSIFISTGLVSGVACLASASAGLSAPILLGNARSTGAETVLITADFAVSDWVANFLFFADVVLATSAVSTIDFSTADISGVTFSVMPFSTIACSIVASCKPADTKPALKRNTALSNASSDSGRVLGISSAYKPTILKLSATNSNCAWFVT